MEISFDYCLAPSVGHLALRHQRVRRLPFLLSQVVGDDHHVLHLCTGIPLQPAVGHRGNSPIPADASITIPEPRHLGFIENFEISCSAELRN